MISQHLINILTCFNSPSPRTTWLVRSRPRSDGSLRKASCTLCTWTWPPGCCFPSPSSHSSWATGSTTRHSPPRDHVTTALWRHTDIYVCSLPSVDTTEILTPVITSCITLITTPYLRILFVWTRLFSFLQNYMGNSKCIKFHRMWS